MTTPGELPQYRAWGGIFDRETVNPGNCQSSSVLDKKEQSGFREHPLVPVWSILKEPAPSKSIIACMDLVLILVSKEFLVDAQEVKLCKRGAQKISLARQICMYLLHTVLSKTYQEIGEFLDRDRTTVAHGCCAIEDMRDDPEFDLRIENLGAEIALLKPTLQLWKLLESEAVNE